MECAGGESGAEWLMMMNDDASKRSGELAGMAE